MDFVEIPNEPTPFLAWKFYKILRVKMMTHKTKENEHMLRSITFNITEAVESYNIMMQQDERSTLVTMDTQEEIEQYILKEVRRQLRWPTTAPSTIVDVEFIPHYIGTAIAQYELYGIFTNGKRTPLFKYYTDELSFTKDEFIGKTIAEAQRLFYDKDTAYLRGEVGGVHA